MTASDAQRELLYLDASALVKLVKRDAESEALLAEVKQWPSHVTSVVGAVEVRRAARRVGADAARTDAVVARVSLLELDERIRELAARVGPRDLRALDAIHLATAISLENDLGALACYDERLADASAREGIRVVAPT
jgi:predicted nucleic acid-binding protein